MTCLGTNKTGREDDWKLVGYDWKPVGHYWKLVGLNLQFV